MGRIAWKFYDSKSIKKISFQIPCVRSKKNKNVCISCLFAGKSVNDEWRVQIFYLHLEKIDLWNSIQDYRWLFGKCNYSFSNKNPPKKFLINDIIFVLWVACLFPLDAAEVLSILNKTVVFCSFLQHNLKLKKAVNVCRYLYWSLVSACCIVGFSPNVWIFIWMNFCRR